MKVDVKAKKSLGQNFLVDNNIIDKIVKIGNIKKNNNILEIGPGLGSLTKEIAAMEPNKIFAVEKDKRLASLLKKNLYSFKNIEIIENDILKLLKKNTFGKNIIIFGNLPYNISIKVLTTLILLDNWPPWFDSLIFMFQKEVADRIISQNKSKNFGRLSVLCNWRLEVKKHFDISKNCFFPKPKVNSTLLSFVPKKQNIYKINNPTSLENITKILFSNRRKMINKSFAKLFKNSKKVSEDLNLNLNLRPEELTNEMFYKITMKYEQLTN